MFYEIPNTLIDKAFLLGQTEIFKGVLSKVSKKFFFL